MQYELKKKIKIHVKDFEEFHCKIFIKLSELHD